MIRWITPLLGTAPASVAQVLANVRIVDVRDLVDKAGNPPTAVREKIRLGCELLAEGRKTVVCCDYGISRSNAVAAGILASFEHISVDAAVRRVLEATGETEIRLDLVNAIRRATEAKSSTTDGRERWLLTGGHGYLGSILAATVPESIDLHRPARKELELLRGGVALDLYVRQYRVTRILHLAAPHVGNTNLSVGESVTMLRNVLDACISNSIPLFLPSRWEVFGAYKGQTLSADEETPMCPAGVIGDAKFLGEKLAEVWAARDGLEVTVLRSGLVFGINGAPNFIRSFIRYATRGETITTHIYANGPPQLDLIYASDWARACWSLLLSGKTGVFHVGGGELISTQKIAEIIVESCGGGAKLDSIPIDDGASNIIFDFNKLSSLIGWRPTGNVASRLADFAKLFTSKSISDNKG